MGGRALGMEGGGSDDGGGYRDGGGGYEPFVPVPCDEKCECGGPLRKDSRGGGGRLLKCNGGGCVGAGRGRGGASGR